MSEPFIGQITMFGGNFAPRNWAFCQGQLLAIASNQALFSILGTTYGGDGETTFALPDLRGRVPVSSGRGPALSDRRLGSRGGVENVTLNVNEIPAHNHTITAPSLNASANPANSNDPAGRMLAMAPAYGDAGGAVAMDSTSIPPHTIGDAGGGQRHTNVQPFLTINFIIALQGIFPSRN